MADKKIALVTGAGWWPDQSPGLGWAIAVELAEAGHHVIAVDKEELPASRVTADLREKGFSGEGIGCDITDPAKVSAAIEQVIAKHGQIDTLVNAAALTMHRWGLKAFHEITPEQCDIEMGVTLKGSMNMARSAIPHMLAKKSGNIVFISSIMAFEPSPKQAVYGLSKAALINLTMSLAAEVGQNGIRVNCVCPGLMKTRVTDKLPPNYMETFLSKSAQHRMSDPREVARVVRFLTSDAASYVNGVAIRVDGGRVG